MQAERWRHIDQVFHDALKLDGNRRVAFLDETCSGDQELRIQIERLLVYHTEAASFLEAPALEMAARELSESGASQLTGSGTLGLDNCTIAHYRVLSKLGSGGMGVVYEAEDLRLGRRVALKLLREDVLLDSQAGRRFEAEAHAASSLNHPNICTIYEVEEHDGRPVIVMELLNGEDFKQRIRSAGAVPLEELIQLAVQASDALAAAHAQGIVHRDIKPANMFLCDGGRLKLLDFGVAKLICGTETSDRPDDDSLTSKGSVVGTMLYMSPEQIQGQDIDARSDLFSFGITLYELATGRRPFARTVPILTADAILHENPPAPSSLNPALPPAMDRLILKLLEKDRELRYQGATELRSDLQKLLHSNESNLWTRSRTAKVWKVAAVFTLIGALAGTAWYWHRAPALTPQDTVMLADFNNKTGDAVFDGTLRQGLAVQLQQSPFLSIVSDERIQQTLHLMAQPTDARLTWELAREVCQRLGSSAILEGSIDRIGSQYLLGFRARACRSGGILDDQQLQVSKKEDVLNGLGRIARKFRNRAGESLAAIRQHETPLPEATTSSLEALKAYSTAWEVLSHKGPAATVPLLQRAIDLDPNFAMAHAFLGRAYADIWESVLSRRSLTQAYKLRGRASDYERFFITLNFHQQVTGNAEKARQTGELWAQIYGRDVAPHASLSWLHQMFGRYRNSVEEAKKAIALDPDFIPGYLNLGWAYIFLERTGEAEATLNRAASRRLDTPEMLVMRYYIAFLKENAAERDRLVAQGLEKSGAEDWISQEQASVSAYYGHLREARSLSQRAVEFASQANEQERAGIYEAASAVREAFFANPKEARQRVSAARGFSDGRDVTWGSALALALIGDTSGAHALVNSLGKTYPEDTYVRFTYLPMLRAVIALNSGEPEKAIDLLQVAAPFDLAVPGSWSGFFGNMYPVYFRGTAYLAAGRNEDAAGEFQKMLDHPGLMFSDPAMAMARLQLSRALTKTGDLPRARKSYRDLLKLWKNADADLPVLKQAKAEYARIR